MKLTSGELQALTFHHQNQEQFKAARLKEHFLSYLAHLPRQMNTRGLQAAGEIALAIGNLLVWAGPLIDPHEPQIEVSLEQTATTLYALGKQFRMVGLAHFNEGQLRETHSLDALKNDLEMLRAKLAVIETSRGEKEQAA